MSSASEVASVAACSSASAVAASTRSPAAAQRSAELVAATAAAAGPRAGAAGRPRRWPAGGPGRCGPARPARRTTPWPGRRRRAADSTSATAAVGGVRSDRWRQRDRTVGSTSSTAGAQSSQTVRGVGSSIAFSSALPAWSVSRSASSTTMTCQRPPAGCRAARDTSCAGVVDADRQLAGVDDLDVGVGAGQRGVAGLAVAAPAVRALQRRGERPGRRRPAGAGRTGEQPGVGHAGAGLAAQDGGRGRRGARAAPPPSAPGRPGRPTRPTRWSRPASPVVAPLLDPWQLHGVVVGGVRRRVVVDGTEQLVDEADLTGRRVVSGDGRASRRRRCASSRSARACSLCWRRSSACWARSRACSSRARSASASCSAASRARSAAAASSRTRRSSAATAASCSASRRRGLRRRLLSLGALLGLGPGPGLLQPAGLGRQPVTLGLLRAQAARASATWLALSGRTGSSRAWMVAVISAAGRVPSTTR